MGLLSKTALDYLKELFIMPNGTKEDGSQEAAKSITRICHFSHTAAI